jgi:hypothetical protein
VERLFCAFLWPSRSPITSWLIALIRLAVKSKVARLCRTGAALGDLGMELMHAL